MEEQTDLAGEGKARRWLAGLALGTVAMLAILPATGWMVRDQVRNTAGALVLQAPNNNPPPGVDLVRVENIAAKNPEDFQLQFAAAVRKMQWSWEAEMRAGFPQRRSEPQGNEYERLTPQFGTSPSLHANLLRLATSGRVHAIRPDSAELLGKILVTSRGSNPDLNRPEAIAEFLEHAASGERLDPENAYFPTMAAVAHFAVHQDPEALEALQRAATKSQWREYYQDQCVGEWRLDEALGRRGAVARSGRAAMLVFPQYSELRNVARTAGYLAMKAEQSGDKERGFQIRRDVMRVGSLMRSQGTSIITNLVGMAIVRIAMSRPDGIAPPPGPVNEEGEKKDARVAREYDAHLTRLGYPDEAAWVRAEREAGAQVRGLLPFEIIGAGLEKPTYTTATFWSGAAMLLLNSVWWGVLGLLAAAIAATRWGRASQPVPTPLKRGFQVGVGTALVAPPLALGFVYAVNASPILFVLGMAGLLAIPIVGGLWLWRNGRKTATWSFLGGVLATSLLLPAAIALVVAQGQATHIRLNLYDLNQPAPTAPWLSWMIGASLALPTLAALVFSIAAKVLRVPVGISLARGFRGAAVPVLSLLLLAYGGTVLATIRQEARLSYNLNRTVENEGRFIAEIARKPWPGPTR